MLSPSVKSINTNTSKFPRYQTQTQTQTQTLGLSTTPITNSHIIDDTLATKKSLFYILNPSGDLKRTQTTFSSLLARNQEYYGVVGRYPFSTELEDHLQTRQLFVYIGHGSGDSIIKRQYILKSNLEIALLMGCSSVSPTIETTNCVRTVVPTSTGAGTGAGTGSKSFKKNGTVSTYLAAKCKAVVGNLWDVGDKDIDRFTIELFKLCGISHPSLSTNTASLVGSVQSSRIACNLKYLTGCSPVVYGLPL
ncbi:Separin [Zancudomyces culisetae]|uniref:separase n=1 Tax=Zancudomyces culisetae TaxID=1213189 RepID=A0A1R1PIK5_ZANCU|nr:Separin [Zancudomyces culisetae]|eukprot:OMH80810.1 Separin [Zancudomyces culisetae]